MDYEARQEIGRVQETSQRADTLEGERLWQGRFLDELPGMAFAAITAVWVVLSFAGLTWWLSPVEFMSHLHHFEHLVMAPPRTVLIVTRMTSALGIAKRLYKLTVGKPPS